MFSITATPEVLAFISPVFNCPLNDTALLPVAAFFDVVLVI